MATKLSVILGRVRDNLQEPVAKLWTDAILYGHINAGIKDLARSLNTQYQNFFFDTDTGVTYVSEAETLSNVPEDVSTILGLELADPTLYPGLVFVYKDYNAAFIAHYKKTTGKDTKVDQSHAGSSAIARSVADGLDAACGGAGRRGDC